jgi:AcrR family transcriptional regulator
MAQREKIITGYIEFELMNGRSPHSVHELTKKLRMTEAVFYDHFGSLEVLRSAVLTAFIEETTQILDGDENYAAYSSREKLLALFFTLFEQFKQQRSYLLAKYSDWKKVPQGGKDWKRFMELLIERGDLILKEGKMQDEVKEIPLIGQHYAKAIPVMFTYIFRVWVNDDSEGFATTDAAIEKSVNLSFDMLGTGPLDALLDFGKFALKTKVL